ncbi:MAG TPA: UDP-N-acetylglucosamine 2-epimerase (non-hydrolyzing) [Holosporales bacterium]|nr:UDP-N-acetylglucosamine 2-epimerase (non-hydrolyzing) [Holosporales bacterium]
MKKRIVTIVGARPQFVKAATLSRLFQNSSILEEVLIHTGQHHDSNMSDIFFQELNIPKPSYFLDIQGGNHGKMTGRMLEAIEEVLLKEKPDAVLVYGDTNSTLAGSLAASKLHVPVIHIEAGLRSFNRSMPEEINRVLTDHVSDILLCPTKTAVSNLQNEGITKGVYHVGDVMYDATLFAIDSLEKRLDISEKFKWLPNDFSLLTVHRADSTDSIESFQKIMRFVHDFAKNNKTEIIFPVHPRTQKLIKNASYEFPKSIHSIDILSYFETHFLLRKAKHVLTDSGGLQKEAYFHRVPCVTLRSETEWVETIDAGWNRLWTEPYYREQKEITDYGSGNSAEKIIQLI